MARVKLELPDSLGFSTDIEVHIGYINYGNYLGNNSMLTLIQEARMRFLKSMGYRVVHHRPSGREVAHAKTEIVIFDYGVRRPVEVPRAAPTLPASTARTTPCPATGMRSSAPARQSTPTATSSPGSIHFDPLELILEVL
jgi:acyl-CoA thioesterase FadM